MMTAPAAAENICQESPESPGLCAPSGHPVEGPLSAKWITNELLERTRRVWSEVYQREISTDEAVEILINVKNLAEVLLDIEEERKGP